VRIDVHTHVVPPAWEDWAAKYGGGRWPRLVQRDACRATIMTGDQFFRDIDDRSWSPARRLEDMDRLGVDRHAIAAVCGTTPEVVSVRLAESRRGKGGARRATGSAKQAPGAKAPPAEPKAAGGADV